MEGCSSSNVEIIKELCNRHPSPISILEPSFSSESYISADSEDNSNRNIGNKQCSSSQAQLVDAETELSDSASSTCTEVACGKHVTRLGMVDDNVSDKKLKYVREILSKPELMFKDLSFGETGEVINYRLFERLETTWSRSDFSTEKDSRLRRKVLFDCVGECMDLRCRRYVVGGYRTWAKGVEMFRNNGCVAEEVYKDISEWGDMGDWMVDELVDKDMSTQYGRWLDFETEEFDFGVEIQKSILSSLLDEVVADF
ncbi:hypothetical protein GIB67_021865 [Kingdonia uniflora]|uniref:DUF4378 domain-containing protein n=1 Tax=Kingdonia uniflora TaxID=39325 RepID=A0A7J7NEI8_9MAGN|nr:hypothetical protein GIB67_021865 [Kingdonia uniflora]